jgi:protein-disulfide isomerase-like protein with CxxC motif
MSSFAVTFDYLCPFARIANELVIQAQEAGAGHEVSFRAFSLKQVHLDEDATPVWETDPPPSGVLALRYGLAVRERFPDSFPAAHLALFEVRHEHGEDLSDPAVLDAAVASVGLDPGEVAKAAADADVTKALAADHTWGVTEHRVFGVPTFVTDERAVFVRLMRRSPDGEAAVATLNRLLEMIGSWTDLNEFKATSIPR